METLRKKISGSIEGEASQKDITGAKGTPPISKAAITGITPQEQKGLNAPTMVAKNIDITGFFVKAILIYLAAPDNFTATAKGIVTIKYGQICQRLFRIKFTILKICSNILYIPLIVFRKYTIKQFVS